MKKDFNIMDCALIAIATGEKAQNLRELRDIIENYPSRVSLLSFLGRTFTASF